MSAKDKNEDDKANLWSLGSLVCSVNRMKNVPFYPKEFKGESPWFNVHESS